MRSGAHLTRAQESVDKLVFQGVSKSLWGEACLAMGREEAAIAVAIVSAKPAGHFRSSPGGYFHGMVAKAKAGELNLVRTIWGLRQRRDRRAGDSAAPRRPNWCRRPEPRLADRVEKARQAARPVASRTTPAAVSCRFVRAPPAA